MNETETFIYRYVMKHIKVVTNMSVRIWLMYSCINGDSSTVLSKIDCNGFVEFKTS
ncbi:MAG: hypothetical protein ACLRQF_02990 [Thomasclavelia ramosa]